MLHPGQQPVGGNPWPCGLSAAVVGKTCGDDVGKSTGLFHTSPQERGAVGTVGKSTNLFHGFHSTVKEQYAAGSG